MASIFLQFEPPSSTAWLFATAAVALAIFFHFSRPFALRNWDLLGLFSSAPGFLLIKDAEANGSAGERLAGYIALLVATAIWLVRCFLDGWIVRRPRIVPNLTPPALFFLGGALLVGLSVASSTKTAESEPIGQRPAMLNGVEQTAAVVVQQTQDEAQTPPNRVRLWAARGLAIACQIAVVWLLIRICIKHFNDSTLAAIAATLYLLLPATAFEFDQSHHVWPTAFLLGAILAYRKPAGAGVLLGLAAGTAFFPVVLFPQWWQFYHGRGSGRFAIGFAIAALGSLAITVLALSLAGDYTTGLWQTLNLAEWQPWIKPKADSVWTGGRWEYRLPLFLAYLALVLTSFVWPSSRNLGQLIAMNAAALLGMQFWFADRGGLYVLWYAPLLILMVLRPTATEMVPPSVQGVHLFGWLKRKNPLPGMPSPGIAV